MRLSELLDVWMRERKISVRDLARQIGVDHTVLHRFRHGEDCKSETIGKILTWLLAGVKAK